MYISILSILFLFFITCTSCKRSCREIPSNFTSYDQAISTIERSSFKINERLNTSSSSWIESASFYGCDGETGYLIIKANGTKYIHDGVPIKIWNDFKDASSFGSYYDSN